MSEYEAVVVGGGIVGASVAYHLGRAGVDTLLCDREDEGRATDAGAGILSPATSSRTASEEWFEFALEAVDYYPTLVDRLAADGAPDPGYAERGLLSVAVDDEEVAAYEAAVERVRERQERLGRPRPGSLAELSPAAARERFPPLATVKRALYYGDAARVDGRQFTRALTAGARTRGVKVRTADVRTARVSGGAIRGVEAAVDGERVEYDADAVVVAGGAWSAEFGEDLGVQIPVEPQRGQIAHLDLQGRDTASWPMVSAFHEQYMVPWDDGRVAVGATRETGSGYAPHTTAEGVRDVLEEALRVAPGLEGAAVEEVRVGLRPVTPDGLPVLGSVPGLEGAFLCTGHGPTGLQLGPYSGKLVAGAVAGGPPAPEQFAVRRFR